MDPLDPAKNDDGSGLFKRRISSILKAPRKSIRSSDPEQQENVVERAKPVEKRNSRRVSFAPANNVLLFSSDVKNTSPARSPLQDLIASTAGTTQNRVQVVLPDDRIQQITGMETLLNAPLHASQQRDKVSFSTDDFGEKTVMFSTEDAFMDMTHSQTINIDNGTEVLADISLQNYEILPTSRDKTVMFTADDGSMDMTQSHTVNIASGPGSLPASKSMDLNTEKRNMSSSLSSLDPGFENFLSSLFKTSGPSVNPGISRMSSDGASSDQTNRSLAQNKTQRVDVDKENQIPTSLPTVIEKSLNIHTKTDQSSHGKLFHPKSDVTLGHVANITSHSGSLPTNKSLDLNAEKRSISSSLPCLDPEFENFLASLFKPSEIATTMPPALASSEQTNGSLAQIKTLQADVDKETPAVMEKSLNTFGKNDQSYGSALNPKNDASMEITETGAAGIQGFPPPDDDDDGSFPKQRMFVDHRVSQAADKTKQQPSNRMLVSFNPKDQTTLKSHFLHASYERQKVDFDSNDEYTQKTIMFSAGDEFMDMTQSHTVNIASGSLAPSIQNRGKIESTTSLPERKNETLPGSSANGLDSGFKNFLASLSKSAPGSNTGSVLLVPPTTALFKEAVDTNSCLSQTKTDVCKQSLNTTRSFGGLLGGGAENPENDVSMDMTEAQTGHITGWDEGDVYLHCEGLKRAEKSSEEKISGAPGSSNNTGTETSLKPALKTKLQGHQVNLDDCRDQTVRFSADDACMDVTRSHTVNIATGLDLQTHQSLDHLPACGEKTVRFSADDAAMDVTRSHTVNIVSDLDLPSQQNVDFIPACGEKTVRFSADDACMDVTRSHTVNIATGLDPQTHHSLDILPSSGEKTVRFSADDACMDVTRSHTVNIATGLDLQKHHSLDVLPACGEKTVRFSADDAAMDVTRSHTVNIATGLDPQTHHSLDILPSSGEKTVRFSADDAPMDVTRSHTVNIVSDLDLPSQQNVDLIPACGEKTVRFSADDAPMDETRSHTVNIDSNSATDSVHLRRDSNILPTHVNIAFPLSVKKKVNETCSNKSGSSSAHSLDPGFKNSLSNMSCPWAKPVITKAVPDETVDTNAVVDQHKTRKPHLDTETEAPDFVSAVADHPVNETRPEDNVQVAVTEAQTDHVVKQTCAEEPPECPSTTQGVRSNSPNFSEANITAQKNKELFNLNCENIRNRRSYPNSDETNGEEPDPLNPTHSSTSDDHVDAAPSHKSRRMSFADLNAKIRRLSHMINTVPDSAAADSCTVPLPQVDQNSKDETQSVLVAESEPEMTSVKNEENTQAQCVTEEEQSTSVTATPFNLKTKQLMSRLSVGGFKPKLPQRSKPDDPKRVSSVGEHTRTIAVDVTSQMRSFDEDVSDIYDEELISCEDMSEVLDTRSPHKASERVSPSQEPHVGGTSEEHSFVEDTTSGSGKKRTLPVDEISMEVEKRMKPTPEIGADFDLDPQSHLAECDSNFTSTQGTMTQTTDESSSSHTASIRCETTFESTLKHSLFESQLEDYANDMQRKFDDGTITVLEFFKLFNIDFVIHNPRQSMLPERLPSDTDHTQMDLLKGRHINRPKHMVYETHFLKLTDKVEQLKGRMRDLNQPLRIVNRTLWEEMKNSSEKELKSFGAKLKERNNLFRKTSKVRSHEMKEVLYSSLVQANLEEQKKLRATIEEADVMIKSLDDCILDLQTELSAVEEKGSEDTPSLKSCQEEMTKVTEAVADNERQISELEMQKKQSSKTLTRLMAETRNLENHVTALHMVNEWRFGESTDNCTVYTFLNETFHLQLVYEDAKGTVADNEPERKISQITFKHQIDEDKSQDHACLVHKLLSQYTQRESAWVEKYSTSRHVPKLLHDVSLVVSHCRLLGEELRLLKMWGGLRLDVLDISCVDTQVHIVFSSLKKISKFEVIFSVSLTDHLYVLQLQSFRNIIGSTKIQQIEEAVASISPGKNLLTKMVKKIHENRLC